MKYKEEEWNMRVAVDLPDPHNIENPCIAVEYFESRQLAIDWAKIPLRELSGTVMQIEK